MKKKLLIALLIIITLLALVIGYVVFSSRNTAKAEAKTVLSSITVTTSGQWYCENGSGKGTDNQTPWWEELYLSNAQPEETAKRVEQHLRQKGYSVSNKYLENSQDSYNQGKTYWEITGARDNYSVEARVSSKELTLNNCFKGFSNMNETISPENFNSVIVIQFKDNS